MYSKNERIGRYIAILLFTITISTPLFSQWECRTQLSPHLKPLFKSDVYWASELTLGVGYLNNNALLNTMGFVGFDYSKKKSTIYAELGYKFWDRYDFNIDKNFYKGQFGIRELFYQYRGEKWRVTAGVQTASFDDFYLLNERMLGVNYKYNNNGWSLNFNGGSVIKGFARNGIFCSVGYLYDIIPGRDLPLLGNAPGQTNFAGATFMFNPSKHKSSKSAPADEFSSSEFDSFTSDETPKKSSINLENIGLVTYSEFGGWVDNPLFASGLFLNLNLPLKIVLKPELLYQLSKGNNGLIYTIALEKGMTLSKSKASLGAKFLGMYAIDPLAKPMNSFSNMFLGDVLRLDARDIPMFQVNGKISFPSIRFHIKLQHSASIAGKMRETDIEFGKRFGKNIQLIAIGGYVSSDSHNINTSLGRIEFRFSF